MSGCYDQDNNENLDQFPCDPNNEFGIKQCCARGDSCASNGLCVTWNKNALTTYFINGCVRPDWDDPTCPKQCYASDGNGIKSCGGGRYCCFGLSGCDCNDEDGVFTMDPIRILTSIAFDASRAPTTTSASLSTSTSSSAVEPTDTSSSRLIRTETSDGAPGTSTSSGGVAAQTSTTSDSDSSGSTLRIGLGVGLGVGIPLLLVIAALVWMLRRKKWSSTHAPLASSPGGTYDDPPPHGAVPSEIYQAPPQEYRHDYQPVYHDQHLQKQSDTVYSELEGHVRRSELSS